MRALVSAKGMMPGWGEVWELSVSPTAVGSMEAKPFPCALLALPQKKRLDKMHRKFGVC